MKRLLKITGSVLIAILFVALVISTGTPQTPKKDTDYFDSTYDYCRHRLTWNNLVYVNDLEGLIEQCIKYTNNNK